MTGLDTATVTQQPQWRVMFQGKYSSLDSRMSIIYVSSIFGRSFARVVSKIFWNPWLRGTTIKSTVAIEKAETHLNWFFNSYVSIVATPWHITQVLKRTGGWKGIYHTESRKTLYLKPILSKCVVTYSSCVCNFPNLKALSTSSNL